MERARRLLARIFGFDGFRPGQEEIVAAMLAGREVLAIMPTGGGKSLCYQLPALVADGLTLVVSPLIALMRDQVRALDEAGVAAGALTSANSGDETRAVHAALAEGRLKLLYMAPERLASGAMLRLLQGAGVARIAVDEAHCVSQWGHDFRPDYLQIGRLRRALGAPLAAFTATADADTRDEIVARLFDGRPPETFLRGFDRPNIHLAFRPKDRPRAQLLEFAAARRATAGIVYCATRARTETLAAALAEAGHAACAYHGGMAAEARREVERRFQTEDGLIVAATVAFGMGVDKPDIRWVLHADLPKSLEAYYQEIGRAGRDGLPAEALALYGADDIRLRRAQIDESLAPDDRRSADHARLNALLGLAEAVTCRRVALLAHFGEASGPCGNCDICAAPPETFDATEAARMALSAALRTGQSFGAGHLIDVLTGTAGEKTTRAGHDRLPTFGVGAGRSRADWQAIIRQMLGRDLLRPDAGRRGALVMTEAARPLLRGEATLTLRRPAPSAPRGRPAPEAAPRALVSEEDEPLLAALKARRRALAEAAKMPAYIVFPDRTLIEMARRRPATLDQMAAIPGVGAKKLERYGETFLAVIAGEAPRTHPRRRRLAGTPAGALHDRLADAARRLERGRDGTGKPLSLSQTEIARIAERRPADRAALARLPGMTERKLDRFAEAILAELAAQDG